jgi:NADPH2:quinone reductase
MSLHRQIQAAGVLVHTVIGIRKVAPYYGQHEARVKVLAAGVAFADVLMRRGLYPGVPPFPFAPGYDIVGDIDAVGGEPTSFTY